MNTFKTLTLITLFGLMGNSIQAHCGHSQHDRAFLRTLDLVANSRSDYWKQEMIEEFTFNNCFNTGQFMELLSFVRSDYYRFELSKFALQYVSNPLVFSDVVLMLRSRYYQRELQTFIYDHPRYIRHLQRQRARARAHRHGGQGYAHGRRGYAQRRGGGCR